jgi:uncharacterized membrane protein YfcA
LAIVLLVFTASELHYWYLGHCIVCLYGIWITSLVSSNVSLKTPNKWFRIWFS